MKFPTNLADQYQEAEGSTGTKWLVATEIMSNPTPKCIQIDQEETEVAAWIEQKTNKASDWLKTISLKESIIWQAWIRGKTA